VRLYQGRVTVYLTITDYDLEAAAEAIEDFIGDIATVSRDDHGGRQIKIVYDASGNVDATDHARSILSELEWAFAECDIWANQIELRSSVTEQEES
jgi:hypothetical protein